MSQYDSKEENKDYVRDESGKLKGFTKTPGVLDYVKEAFEPTNERAQLNAIRNRREKSKGST